MNSFFSGLEGKDSPSPELVIGVVVGTGFDHPDLIQETLSTVPRDALFVLAQPKRTGRFDCESYAREFLEGRAVVFNPMNPWWKHARGDDRRKMIDCELALYCSSVVVFDDGKDQRMRYWRDQAPLNPKVRLVTAS